MFGCEKDYWKWSGIRAEIAFSKMDINSIFQKVGRNDCYWSTAGYVGSDRGKEKPLDKRSNWWTESLLKLSPDSHENR